ncbi:MAG TPA: hypothetical protein VIV12_21615 [Streptosporangiaceae bacterium]
MTTVRGEIMASLVAAERLRQGAASVAARPARGVVRRAHAI